MTTPLIDSHCHLDDARFDADRDAVLARARQCGVDRFVVPATTADSWPKLRQLATQDSSLCAAYGLHPMFMRQHEVSDIQALDSWLDAHPAVAVGECGLDFYQSRDDEARQLEIFRGQLELAVNRALPLIIHARKSLDTVLRELRRAKPCGGVIHSFSGSLQQARQLVDLGFKLGIAATVGFERARRLREVVASMDTDALLIESDAPDQPGPGHRGQRNEPGFIIDHLQVMAQLREVPAEQLARQLNANCRALFALSD